MLRTGGGEVGGWGNLGPREEMPPFSNNKCITFFN